jgi:hypothetical protein
LLYIIKVLVCVLLVSFNSAKVFAENNIVGDSQVIQQGLVQSSDNKVFQDLIQVDEVILDIAGTSLLRAQED